MFAIVSVLLASPSTPRKKLLNSIKTDYLFRVTNVDGKVCSWLVDMKKKGAICKLATGERAALKPDVILEIGDEDLVKVATGQISPQKLFAAQVCQCSPSAASPSSLQVTDRGVHLFASIRQRVKVKGSIDRAMLVEKILTQEREKIMDLSKSKAGGEKKERGRWAAITVAAKAKL